MRFSLTALCRSASKVTYAALCMATWLAAGQVAQAAYGVTVNQQGDTLYVTGNDYANSLSIVGSEDDPYGTVGVFVTDVPWVYTGVNNIHVDLEGGDDFLALARIKILGDLTILTGSGADEVIFGWNYQDSAIAGDVEITTAGGSDNVLIEKAWVSGSVTVNTGNGNDWIELGGNIAVLRKRLDVNRTADGGTLSAKVAEPSTPADDLIATKDDVEEGKFTLGMALGFDPSIAFGSLFVFAGDDNDMVGITLAEIDVETSIELGNQNDSLLLEGPNAFYGDFIARGQGGTDGLYEDPPNYYENDPTFLNFELN